MAATKPTLGESISMGDSALTIRLSLHREPAAHPLSCTERKIAAPGCVARLRQ